VVSSDCPEPQVLEEGKADERQQRVVVQAAPGAPLEVVEPEFFLQLLVRLLAAPARRRTPAAGSGMGVVTSAG
jgi:hypothetical protein